MNEVWFVPNDPKVSIHIHLALGRFVRGDEGGAEDQLGAAARLAAGLAFPQGPFSAAYVLAFKVWMRLEAGDFDGADEAVAELTSIARRHGFDSWTLVAVTEETTANALRTRDEPAPDPAVLSTNAAMLEGLIAAWSQFDIKVMLPFYLTTLGTIVGATGDTAAARTHLESSLELAKTTGMHFAAETTPSRRTAPSEVLAGRCSTLDPDRACTGALYRSSSAPRWTSSGSTRRRMPGMNRRRDPPLSLRGPVRRRSTARAAMASGSDRRVRSRDRIAILGGGMAGMAAAWRLSEPGWREEFESITVYQRGWRLGGGKEQPSARSDGSRSTACTSGSAPTTTRFGSCASVTPSSTVRPPTRPRACRRGGTP